MDPITQLLVNLLTTISQGLTSAIQPVFNLIQTTPLYITTANPVVDLGWNTMTGVADALLVLLGLIALIQMLYGQQTGSLYLPLSHFVPKLVLTAILIHLSQILGQDLVILNNLLCGLVRVNVMTTIEQGNGGQPFNGFQQSLFGAIVGLTSSLVILRIVFQAIKRIAFVNLLFILSGPAILLSFHPQTTPAFSFWARTYLVTILTQFVQFLAFGLAIQFLLTINQTGVVGDVIFIALMTLVAELPGLLARFSASAGANVQGIGGLVRTAITAAGLFV